MKIMDEDVEYYPGASDVEVDSDHDDQDAEKQLGDWLGQLETLKMGLDPEDTGTVKRRNKTVVTPKMAMESFRYSFLNSDEPQDVNLDAILGELCELESQLTTTQSELSQTLGRNANIQQVKDDNRDSGNDFVQAELDALAAEIQSATGPHFLTVGDIGFDVGEADSAFSDNTSLPSSESFTSMVTVSSSADTSSSASGETASTNSTSTLTAASLQPGTEVHEQVRARLESVREDLVRERLSPEEQKARLKAEKIRIALEKIKEAKIRKLFVRAFTQDGSSKSILVDEKMTVGLVCNVLAEKNHIRLNDRMAVVEHLPELYMERILEDHDSLVENMVMWTRDSKNKILYEERAEKYDLFRNPEKYLLLGSSSEKGISLDPSKRHRLLQEYFSGVGVQIPEVEGVLYLKTDGKKAWKKFFFVLRGSGLYYNPKGKISKSSRDLSCLLQFDLVEVYKGLGWKKKYNAPTDYCFALKHPQVQKKTSKYMRYLCAENKSSMEAWMMGIRIAKCGKQLLDNYERVRCDVISWDRREPWTNQLLDGENESNGQPSFNREDLSDSRLSVPDVDRHSIITVTNCSTASNSPRPVSANTDFDDGVFMMDGTNTIQRSPHYHQNGTESPQKTPVKRVSFSTTHCIINADSCEELVHMHHRDSITSASTDTSDESTSSGEGRVQHPRGKMRAKIPVTTETTRQISGMVQLAMENSSVNSVEGAILERKSSISSCGSGHGYNIERSTIQRRKSAPQLHSASRETRGEAKVSSPSHQNNSPLIHPASPSASQTPTAMIISSPAAHNMVLHEERIATAPRSPGTPTHQKRPSLSSLQGDLRNSPPRSPVAVAPPVPPATLPGVPAKKTQPGVNVMSCPPIKTPPRASTPPRAASTPHAPPTPPKTHIRRTSGGGPVPVAPPTPPISHAQPPAVQQRINGHVRSDYGVPSAARASCGIPPPPPPNAKMCKMNETIPPPPSVTSMYGQAPPSSTMQNPIYSGIPPSPSQMASGIPPSPSQMASGIPPSPSQMASGIPPSPSQMSGVPPSPGQISGGMPSPPYRNQGAMHAAPLPQSPHRVQSSVGVPPPPPPSSQMPPPPARPADVPPPPATGPLMVERHSPPPPPPASKPVPNPSPVPPPVAAKPQGPPAVAKKPTSSNRPSQYAAPKCVPPPPPPAAAPLASACAHSPQEDALTPVSPSGSGLPFLSELAQKSKQPKVVSNGSAPEQRAGSAQYGESSSTQDASHYAQIRAGIAKHFQAQRGPGEPSIANSPSKPVPPPVPTTMPPPPSVPTKPTAASSIPGTPPSQPPSVASKPVLRADSKISSAPPPPRRSESTRLSTRGPKGKSLSQQEESPTREVLPQDVLSKSLDSQPVDPALQRLQQGPPRRGTSPQVEGILPIEDLPPPPPELLEGLPSSPGSGPSKKPKPPPPPPKRNKDTHLTNS